MDGSGGSVVLINLFEVPAGGVVLINAFEVPPDADDAFVSAWEATRQLLRDQPGYLATRLHRSLSPDTRFRFVNIGRYESPRRSRPPLASLDSARQPPRSSTAPIPPCTKSCGTERH